MRTCKTIQLGPKGDRGDKDFYSTDLKATVSLFATLRGLQINLSPTVIEPSVGKGHIARVLVALKHKPICYDIVDRGWAGTVIADWKEVQRPTVEPISIVMNPPYCEALEHLTHALEMLQDGEYCCALLRLQFLESVKRKKFFTQYPPRYVAVFSFRIMCAKNDEDEQKKKHSAVAFAWYIWEKGYKGNPELLWI